MTSIDLFLPLLAPMCAEASEPLMRQAVARSARELCQRTNILQDVTTASTRAQVGEYSVDTPSTQVNVHQLLGVAFHNQALNLVASSEVVLPLALRGAVGGVAVEYGSPREVYFKTPSGDAFWLYPVPDAGATDALTVRASFAPKLTATSLDDTLYLDWVDVVVAGAAARLLSMPRQPWTSPQSAVYAAQFEAGVIRAKRDASMGRVKSTLAVKPRSFV